MLDPTGRGENLPKLLLSNGVDFPAVIEEDSP